MAKAKTTKKKVNLRGLLAVLVCIVALAGVVWATGSAITGKVNPAEWRTVQTEQPATPGGEENPGEETPGNDDEGDEQEGGENEDETPGNEVTPGGEENPGDENGANTGNENEGSGEGEEIGSGENGAEDNGEGEENAPSPMSFYARALSDDNAGIELHSSGCPECGGSMSLWNTIEGDCNHNEVELLLCDNSEECSGSVSIEIPNSKNPNNHVSGGTWTITTNPVGDTSGVESYLCTGCGVAKETRSIFALPADPEQEGYHFVGWYKDEALTIPYNSDFIYEDTSLYAKFEINVHTVTFETNGGTEMESISTNWNTTITTTTPEKEGYNFLGWLKPNGEQFEDSEPIKGDMTLIARWQIKTFTVTFYVNDVVYTTVTVEYGSVLSKVADDAAVFARNIVYFANVNTTTTEVDPAAMYVMDDVVVYANEPTLAEKVLQEKYVPWIIGGACAVVFIGLMVFVAVKTKKKRG